MTYATWSNEHVETMHLLDRIDAALKRPHK